MILDSGWTRLHVLVMGLFAGLLAKFVAAFRDVAFEHGENLAIARDIQNSQSRGRPANDFYNRGRRKHRSHPIAVVVEGGRNHRFT
jgi:hypothetical protein